MANDVYQLVIAGNCAGQFWEMTPHFQSNVDTSPNPVGAATNLIDGFIASAQDSLLDCLSTDTNITGYKSKRVNNGGGPTVMKPITPAGGTEATTSATSATAGCIILSYQHLMKFHAGKQFLPGIPEGFLTGNDYTAAYISLVNAYLGNVSSFSQGGNSFTLGVWSRKFSLFFAPQFQGLSHKPGIQKRRLLPTF